MTALLSQVNAVYIQGDSDLLTVDQLFVVAISYVLDYVYD